MDGPDAQVPMRMMANVKTTVLRRQVAAGGGAEIPAVRRPPNALQLSAGPRRRASLRRGHGRPQPRRRGRPSRSRRLSLFRRRSRQGSRGRWISVASASVRSRLCATRPTASWSRAETPRDRTGCRAVRSWTATIPEIWTATPGPAMSVICGSPSGSPTRSLGES